MLLASPNDGFNCWERLRACATPFSRRVRYNAVESCSNCLSRAGANVTGGGGATCPSSGNGGAGAKLNGGDASNLRG